MVSINLLRESDAVNNEKGGFHETTTNNQRRSPDELAAATHEFHHTALKRGADQHSIAILPIHHLRKEPSEDVFNRISSTTAISGVVGSSFTLVNDGRGSNKVKLFCIGRDIEYREISLERNGDNIWEMVSDSYEQPQSNESRIIFLLSELLQSQSEFIGTPTELSNRIDPDKTTGITPRKIARQILQSVDALREIGITAITRKSNGKRIIELHMSVVSFPATPRTTALSALWTWLPSVHRCEAVCAVFSGWDEEAPATGEIGHVRRLWGKLPRSTGSDKMVRGTRTGERPPFRWGKHRVRLYAVRTRRGKPLHPPAPEGEKGEKCRRRKQRSSQPG